MLPGANGHDQHLEADVQDIDVSNATFNFTCLLMTCIRKKAGASEQAVSRGVAMGMTESIKQRAMEALAGHMGETDDLDEDD